MNIFYLDSCPKLAAQYHCNTHVNKMLSETAQLLCTVERMRHNKQRLLYTHAGARKPRSVYVHPTDVIRGDKIVLKLLMIDTHHNHPCTINLRKSKQYLQYTISLFHALVDVWGKHHECIDPGLTAISKLLISGYLDSLPDSNYVPLAMPDIFKKPDPVEAYRKYYNYKLAEWKQGTPTQQRLYRDAYKNRERPFWYTA